MKTLIASLEVPVTKELIERLAKSPGVVSAQDVGDGRIRLIVDNMDAFTKHRKDEEKIIADIEHSLSIKTPEEASYESKPTT